MHTPPEVVLGNRDATVNVDVDVIRYGSESPRSEEEEREPAEANIQGAEADIQEAEADIQEPETEVTEPNSEIFEDCESVDEPENVPQETERRYPLRDRKKKEFPDYVFYNAEMERDPETVREALSRSDSKKWRAAIQEELDALKKNGTWTLVKPQRATNVVDSKWLFRIKEEAGNKLRYKARLVARGFSQRHGVDYDETFSPVVRHGGVG